MDRTENLQAFGVRTPDVLTSYFRAYRLAQFSRDAIAERFPRARKKRSAGASRLNVADERTLARGGANPIRSLIETRGPVKGWAHRALAFYGLACLTCSPFVAVRGWFSAQFQAAAWDKAGKRNRASYSKQPGGYL